MDVLAYTRKVSCVTAYVDGGGERREGRKTEPCRMLVCYLDMEHLRMAGRGRDVIVLCRI